VNGTRTTRLSGADRRRQILRVAGDLFSRHGFTGTTTREIAKRARVNEAIIFRHFPTKEDLYWGVIDDMCQRREFQKELQQRLQKQKDLRELFVTFSKEVLQRDTKLTRLLLFCALENHKLSERFFQTFVAKYYEILAAHIRQRMNEGELRKMDPLLASRGFLGMIAYHRLIQEIYGWKRFQDFDVDKVSETFTDIWLNGVLTKRRSHSRNNRKKKEKNDSAEAVLAQQ